MEILKPYHIRSGPILARASEVDYLLTVLNRRGNRRRALLIGKSGTGRATLLSETVKKLNSPYLPVALNSLKPTKVDLSFILTHSLDKILFDKFSISEDLLLIIENLDFLFNFANHSNNDAFLSRFMVWLLSGNNPILSTISIESYNHYFLQNSTWEHSFLPYNVSELPLSRIRKILLLWRNKYQKEYQVEIPLRIIDEILELGNSLLEKQAFPKSGIELIEACAASASLKEKASVSKKQVVTEEDLYSHISQQLKIPVGNYLGIEQKRVENLLTGISYEIKGQEKALTTFVKAVQHALLGTREPGHPHPLGIFLFMGPTGVGKTETARALARHLFGKDQSIMLNMAEFQDPLEAINRLKSSALAQKIKHNPFSVVILDEIEKAPFRVREFFLNLFDYGLLSDINEHEIRADKTFFIMTSNVGSDLFDYSRGVLPESFSDHDYKIKKEALLEALKKESFRPEFINRIDELILFKPLNRHDILNIIKTNLKLYSEMLKEREDKNVNIDPGVIQLLANGCNLNFGARDARRIIRRNIYSRILKTEDYYKAENINISRSKALRASDYVKIIVCSKNPKDGISLILKLNATQYNLDIQRLDNVKEIERILPGSHTDLVLLHSSLSSESTERSNLVQALSFLKKLEHRAQIFLVIDSRQPLNQYKEYVSEGVTGLLRVSEIEDWLVGKVAEIKQRKKINQSYDFNIDELSWVVTFNDEDRTFKLILE